MTTIATYPSTRIVIFVICAVFSSLNMAQISSGELDRRINNLLVTHYNKFHDAEYFSGAALSVYLPKNDFPDRSIRNYFVGNVSRDTDSRPISADTLFQIGSISKSFTGALILQLEREGKISLADTAGTWLPQYPKWAAVDIRSMLNMTSGLPNYSDTPLWNTQEANKLDRAWTEAELIDFVYPAQDINPPLKTGYFYTNTGYILAGLAAEKAGNASIKEMFEKRLFEPADLRNTFYPVPRYQPDEFQRMAHGYNYNQYDNPMLTGKDVTANNLTWAGAAGGILSTSEDVIKWVKALFVDKSILDAAQQLKLTRIISLETGTPIDQATNDDPRAFGLGVIQAFNPDIGRYWFYEGETLGFRALYMYSPCNGLIISTIFNSATNGENDNAGKLIMDVYQHIRNDFPEYQCPPA